MLGALVGLTTVNFLIGNAIGSFWAYLLMLPVVMAFGAIQGAVVEWLGVRQALKAVARPHRLGESPLLRSRLVRERGGEPVEALRALLAEAAHQLDEGVRERPYFRALALTYFRPAPTQAIASERLDLPFSTYRRHLRRGVEHVVDVLWRAETGG